MGGLLYKDFVSVKGKTNIWVTVVITVLFLVLRMMFPGTEDITGFVFENDAGEMVNFIDTFFFQAEFAILFSGAFYINVWASKIVMSDEKNKVRGYLLAMPFDKKSYVASKYIFIGIVAYVEFSVYMVWHVADLAFMREGRIMDITYLCSGIALPLVCFMLLTAAFEFPLYFLWGKAKAKMVTIGFWMVIGFLVLWFLMFGDLNLVANFDFEVLVNWANHHEFELVLVSVLSPIIVMVIYYVSYHITAHFYVRREEANE